MVLLVGRVLTKLALRDRIEAVIYAYEAGMIRPGTGRAPTGPPSNPVRNPAAR